MEIRQKNLNHRVRLSRSLKVIGTDTDRSATDDFLLVVWSIATMHGPLGRTVSEMNVDFSRKSQNFPTLH